MQSGHDLYFILHVHHHIKFYRGPQIVHACSKQHAFHIRW